MSETDTTAAPAPKRLKWKRGDEPDSFEATFAQTGRARIGFTKDESFDGLQWWWGVKIGAASRGERVASRQQAADRANDAAPEVMAETERLAAEAERVMISALARIRSGEPPDWS
jgi:hypothetical protein